MPHLHLSRRRPKTPDRRGSTHPRMRTRLAHLPLCQQPNTPMKKTRDLIGSTHPRLAQRRPKAPTPKQTGSIAIRLPMPLRLAPRLSPSPSITRPRPRPRPRRGITRPPVPRPITGTCRAIQKGDRSAMSRSRSRRRTPRRADTVPTARRPMGAPRPRLAKRATRAG